MLNARLADLIVHRFIHKPSATNIHLLPATPVEPWVLILASVPGLLLAFWLYGPILDPREVEWLLAEDDSLQHFSGWDMFRRDIWRWPLGAVPRLGSLVDASIVYTDSIPVIALTLKILHRWLPDPLQYIGPLMLVNLMLNGAIAAGLLRAIGGSRFTALAGALLVVSLPMVTMRGPGALGHEALSSHWLLFIAMWLSLKTLQDQTESKRRGLFLGWLALLVMAVLIHFYLFFMAGIFWLFWLLREAWYANGVANKLLSLTGEAAATIAAVVLAVWLAGYFYFGLIVRGYNGFGHYSAEMLSFINPGSASLFFQAESFHGVSSAWNGWRPPIAGYYEGFAYLGLGCLLLVAFALWLLVRHGRQLSDQGGLIRTLFALGVPSGILFFLALGDQLVLGAFVIKFQYPDWSARFTELLRSSGRMIWPLAYFCLFGALLVIDRLVKKFVLGFVIAIIVLVQYWDVSSWHGFVQQQVANASSASSSVFAWRSDPQVMRMLAMANEIQLLPGDDWQQLKIISWLSARYDLISNVAYFARTSPSVLRTKAQGQLDALAQGELAPGVVYAITDAELVLATCQRSGVFCYSVDKMALAIIANQL